MKKTITLLQPNRLAAAALVCLAGILTAASSRAAVVTVKDADLGNGTYNWTNNNVYMLDGFVYLESGGVLNIQEGTVIKGLASPTTGDNASALIITVGAQIFAIGTATQPIIFTSEIDDLNDPNDLIATDRGLWGGLILLGDGILGNSTPTSNIEGIPTTEPRAQFGGSNNANNAGTIKYVSIRHGGAELAPGDEINGLTLGGVGSGTTIEHVEIFSNLDDGIEFFGGAVNIKWAAIAFCGDDGFDWDLGWVGNGQFWFVLQGTDEGDNGGEWDGAIPDGNAVYSNPTVYNLTFIGSGNGAAATNTNAVLMRDATAGIVGNSIFTDYANRALEVEDLPAASGIDSYTRMLNGELKLLNNLWYGFGNYTTFDADPNTGIIRATAGGDDPTCAALITHLTNNNNQLTNPMLGGISRLPNNMLDPRPNGSGPATSGLATVPGNPFFSTVNFKGAFDVSGTNMWIYGWTALDEYGYLPPPLSVQENGFDGPAVSLYPNPADNMINVSWPAGAGARFSAEVLTLGGQRVTPVMESLPGRDGVQIDLSSLAGGLYLLRATSETGTTVSKFSVH